MLILPLHILDNYFCFVQNTAVWRDTSSWVEEVQNYDSSTYDVFDILSVVIVAMWYMLPAI